MKFKKLIGLALILAVILPVTACGGGGGDQSTPSGTVQILFDAASSKDFAALGNLCDPKGENDGDTRSICALATDDADAEEFVEYFSKGKISGDAVIEGNKAEVPFLFGPDGKREETMRLVQRDGKWYLSAF